jgi:hypothetical protein
MPDISASLPDDCCLLATPVKAALRIVSIGGFYGKPNF